MNWPTCGGMCRPFKNQWHRFSSLSAITDHSPDPDLLQARADHSAAPWACTLQHCRLCRHSKAWPQTCDAGTRMRLTRGRGQQRSQGDPVTRDEWHRCQDQEEEEWAHTERTVLCPVIMGTCHGARSAKNSGKWRSPVSPAGPCLVQIRTLRSPMSLVLSTRHRFPRPLALAANLETSTSRHVSNVVIACWS